ncbi:MAG: hypothetical protein HYW25_02825 [Candidatus Aenigmarchaeota archaeon]|nr:hypothetical protein [Candidatus Aenigmarchaeota archaeon]
MDAEDILIALGNAGSACYLAANGDYKLAAYSGSVALGIWIVDAMINYADRRNDRMRERAYRTLCELD